METSTAPGPHRHFVTVWNPSYSEDPMDAHLAVLLKRIEDYRSGMHDQDHVYVWWGKVKSKNRVQDLPHADLIQSVAAKLASEQESQNVRLYLTDYRSLYVGQVTQMTSNEVRDNDPGHVAEYMRKRERPETPPAKGEVPPYQFAVDWWFKLSDIRRLVLDDTVSVVQELAILKNTQYHDRPVSLYGGMVNLPLVVTSDDERSYFDPKERDHFADRKWWVELDSQRGRGIAEIERDLRDNVIGESTWSVFDPTARAFIADGERLFRAHRTDPSFDFSGAILNFAKAIEIHFRSLVRAALDASPGLSSVVKMHGKDHDLRKQTMPTLGQLAHLAQHDEVFRTILQSLKQGDWLIKDFTSIVARLAPVRNDAAHDERVDLQTATEWRNAFLGVGRGSILVDLTRVQRRK